VVRVGSKFLKPALSTNKLICWHSNICPIAFGPLRESYLCNHRQMLATLLSPFIALHLKYWRRFSGPVSHNLRDYHKEGKLKAVMLPAHVYKHWRDVALSTPTLWTNIVLDVTNETFQSRAALVTAWFFRSGAISPSKDERMSSRSWLFFFQHCNH
jgi:hypothetical protein